MSGLTAHVDDYLRLRRGLGFKLTFEGVVLPQFVEYLQAAGAISVTTELSIAWAQLPQGVAPISWSHRLGAVRGFARYMTTIDASTQVPPSGVFGGQAPRPTPYLWSERDIRRLLKAVTELQSPFRAATYESFLGLLAVSGLRSGEAMSLQAGDIDLDAGVITVSQAKFGRARLIPLHSSTTTKLRSYACRRDGLHPRPRSKTFFVSEVGASLKSSTVNHTFLLRHSLPLHDRQLHRNGRIPNPPAQSQATPKRRLPNEATNTAMRRFLMSQRGALTSTTEPVTVWCVTVSV